MYSVLSTNYYENLRIVPRLTSQPHPLERGQDLKRVSNSSLQVCRRVPRISLGGFHININNIDLFILISILLILITVFISISILILILMV